MIFVFKQQGAQNDAERKHSWLDRKPKIQVSGFIPCNLFEIKFEVQLPDIPFVVNGYRQIFPEGDSDQAIGTLT